MKGTLRYLVGVAGPSGFGSNSAVEQVTQNSINTTTTWYSSSITSSHHHHPLTAIITGATSGIGAETARVLAKRGVKVVLHARDLQKGGEVKEKILKENPKAEIILLKIDLSSFATIKRLCSEFAFNSICWTSEGFDKILRGFPLILNGSIPELPCCINPDLPSTKPQENVVNKASGFVAVIVPHHQSGMRI